MTSAGVSHLSAEDNLSSVTFSVIAHFKLHVADCTAQLLSLMCRVVSPTLCQLFIVYQLKRG